MTSTVGGSTGPTSLGPEQVMGLAGLLRSWRASAGERLGHGKPLSQDAVCALLGRSVRWYRGLENGAQLRLERSLLDDLANALHLGPDERTALHYYALGGAITGRHEHSTNSAHQNLESVLERLLPQPAYLSNRHWDIVGYNNCMANWFPWVTKPNANLMRWALLSDEARSQHSDWVGHARAYLALLRFAQAEHPQDQKLINLIAEILQTDECRRLWTGNHDVSATRDGHLYRMCLPAHGFEEIDILSQVLRPATLPDHRLVVLTWLRDETDSTLSREPAIMRNRSEHHRMDADTQSPAAAPLTVNSEYAAQALAGRSGIPLPELSRVAGTRCSLTLSPETRSIIWATENSDGRWSASEIAAYTTLVRLPHAVSSFQARGEYKQLVRHALPAEEGEAVERLRTLALQHEQRAGVLREILEEITGRDEWHPVDEI